MTTFERLMKMDGLTDEARETIETTSGQLVDEIYGNFQTAEEINEYVAELLKA